MTSPLKIALRFLGVLAALALVAGLLGPADPSQTPYDSGISKLSIGDYAFAAPKCAKKECVVEGGSNDPCRTTTNVTRCGTPVRRCITISCN
jgi:hypothetical protein